MSSVIPLRCRIDDFTGYGQYTVDLIRALRERDDVRTRVMPIASYFMAGNPDGPVSETPPPDMVEVTPCRNHAHPWELVHYTLVVGGVELTPHKATAFFTMWESTRMPADAVARLNRCKVVMVPSGWGAGIFSSLGVETPIRVVNLGIEVPPMDLTQDDERLADAKAGRTRPIIIGAAARWDGGGIRKRADLVVEAFLQAFPADSGGRGARLELKAFKDCPVQTHSDPRITVIKDYWTREQLRAWYRHIDVFASASGAEGWGLHQQEAMAAGRPVIGVNFGGVTEFWSPDNGFAVEYKLVPGQGVYHGHGHYAEVNVDSMSRQMLRAATQPRELAIKGALSASAARRLTMKNSADRLCEVLREFKLI